MFFAALLWIMPILVAVFVVVYIERVKAMNLDVVDRRKPNDELSNIFFGVAITVNVLVDRETISMGAAQAILRTLINELCDAGWDDTDKALRTYSDVPYFVQAFKDCDIELIEE